MIKRFFSVIIVSSIVVLASIAGEKQTVKPKEEGPQINKLLVIVLVMNLENRITLEDELKYTFGDYGVTTIPSNRTILKNKKKLTKEGVLQVCKENNIDGVLLIKLLDSEQQNSYSYNQRSQYTGGTSGSATGSGVVFANGSTYSWGEYAMGNYFDAVSSTKVVVQSDIHHITDGHEDSKILFIDNNRFTVSDAEEAIGKFAKKLTKKIVKKKILVQTKD